MPRVIYRNSRRSVYEVIDGERDYQDNNFGDNPHSVTEFLTFMQHYLSTAVTKVSTTKGDTCALDEVRKITALGVVCMEQNGFRNRVSK